MGKYLDIKRRKERNQVTRQSSSTSKRDQFKPYITEDWIKCELYRRLSDLGFECYPEMQFTCDKTYKSRRGIIRKVTVRADLAIYKNDVFLCVIEIKNRVAEVQKPEENGRQYKRYNLLGVNFLYCMGQHQIDETIESILTNFG